MTFECFCGYETELEGDLESHVVGQHPQEFAEHAQRVLEQVVSDEVDEFMKSLDDGEEPT